MSATLTLLDRQQAGQGFTREWLRFLTGTEAKIVLMILDRTVNWGRAFCAISVPEFAQGRKGSGKGTGLACSTIYRVVKALEDKGVITRQTAPGRRTVYGINFDWRPEGSQMAMPTAKPGKITKGLKPPKKPVAKTPLTGGGVQRETPLGGGGHRKGTNNNRKETGDAARQSPKAEASPETLPDPAPEKPGLLTGIARKIGVVEKHSEARAAQARVADKLRAIQDRWAEAFREQWPDAKAVPWSPKARGLFKHARRNGVFRSIDPEEFAGWVLGNWGLIRQSTFKWMDGCPAVPSPEFVMVQIYRLAEAYANRDALLRKAGLSTAQRDDDALRASQEAAAKAREEADDLRRRLAQETHARQVSDALRRANLAPKPRLEDF